MYREPVKGHLRPNSSSQVHLFFTVLVENISYVYPHTSKTWAAVFWINWKCLMEDWLIPKVHYSNPVEM